MKFFFREKKLAIRYTRCHILAHPYITTGLLKTNNIKKKTKSFKMISSPPYCAVASS